MMVVAASLRSDLVSEISLIAMSLGFIAFFRSSKLWGKSIRFYLFLGAFVVAIRVLFRIVFSTGIESGEIALNLPILNLGPIGLLGPVSFATLSAALSDGLRLAAIIIAIGMANTLANPKRLLKSTPGALYEIATAMTVAINLAPQLIESLQRVRKARSLRGRSKGLTALPSIVIPALEDTIEQSLALAASMDARGFGRRGELNQAEIIASRALSLGGLLALSLATYFFLATKQDALGITLALVGIASIAVTIRLASRRNLRTRHKKQRLNPADAALGALGISIAVLAVIL